MNKIPERSHQWFEVQRHLGQVHVARQSGDLPRPQPGQALLKMVACGICGADIRVVSGDKSATGEPDRFTVLGHEGLAVSSLSMRTPRGFTPAITSSSSPTSASPPITAAGHGDWTLASILSLLGAVKHCTWAGISTGVSPTSCLSRRQIWCVSPGSTFTEHQSRLLGSAKQFLP